ncbi:hypothetical protein ALQ18_05187 [Pseudomonas marginalis pv. marginalis]|nr:hypothetical protein ALQ18_05187 [Pseudomonas marginalis pv. marginalis]
MRWISQRSGVSNLTAFGHGLARRQRDGSGVDRIGNGGYSRCSVRHQVFKVAAGNTGNRSADRRAIGVNIIGGSFENYSTNGFTCLNNNRLTIRKRHCHWRLRWVSQRGGVSNLTAFGHSLASRQRNGGGIDRIGNGGYSRRWIRHQILKVAASHTGNRRADRRAIGVNIVGRGIHGNSANRLTRLNSDHRAVAQGDSHWRLRWVSQRGGISNLTAFGHSLASRQRNSSGIDRISNGGYSRRWIRNQILKVTASHTGNRSTDSRAIGVNVVSWSIHGNSANRLTGLDGNHRAVAQGDSHWRLRWVSQRGGISNLPAFGHGLASGQRNGGGVDRIGHLGDGRRSVGGQRKIVTTGCTGHGDADLAGINVRAVIGGQRHVDGAGGLAGGDGDHRAVGQGDVEVACRRLCHGGGVGQYAACFGDGRGRAQAQGRGLQGLVARAGGGLGAGELSLRRVGLADWGGREADSRVDAASGCVQHDEAVATAGCAITGSGWACGRGFQVGGRVGTGGDGLLQFGNRRRGLLSGSRQVEAGIRRVGAPLGISAQVQRAAVCQFQGH